MFFYKLEDMLYDIYECQHKKKLVSIIIGLVCHK
jgi:hypothetical protein